MDTATEKRLLYREWVERNREYVSRISKGRLGYVHLFDMGSDSLDQLFLDLDAENHSRDGVVVDVRNNNGGFVNAYALDVLTRKGYLNMTLRGIETAPARSISGSAITGAADGVGGESAFALRRGGFHRGLSDAEAGQGGGRTHRGLDHLHMGDAVDRWLRPAACRASASQLTTEPIWRTIRGLWT